MRPLDTPSGWREAGGCNARYDLKAVESLPEPAPGRLSVRRMKAIFKRWLDFELKHGSDQQADHVRQSAREYVQSIGSA